MCRLLAHVSPTAVTTADVIGSATCTDWQRLSRLHADGWGTAWVDGGQVHRHRDAHTGLGSSELAESLLDAPTPARLTHLRLATEGLATQVDNTHPFQVGDIALAQNGSLTPIARLRAKVTDAELARVGGDTDTAMVFALILRRHESGASLFDAVTETVTELRGEFPAAAMNLLVLSPAELIVVHANEGAPVPYDLIEECDLGDDVPVDHLEGYYRMSWRRDEDGTVAFTSSGLTGDGWARLAPEHAVRVDIATLEVTERSVCPLARR